MIIYFYLFHAATRKKLITKEIALITALFVSIGRPLALGLDDCPYWVLFSFTGVHQWTINLYRGRRIYGIPVLLSILTSFFSFYRSYGSIVTFEISGDFIPIFCSSYVSHIVEAYTHFSEEDVTKAVKFRLLEKELEILSSANKSKTMFVNNISHDLRTPIQSLSVLMSLLTKTPLNLIQRSYCRNIRSSIQNLSAIVHNVLDFAKMETGNHLQIEDKKFDLFDLLSTIISSLVILSEQKSIYLKTDSRVEIVDQYYIGDAKLLGQALANIIGNAIKFTSNGGVTISLSSSASSGTKRKLRFVVKDTGKGMSDEYIKNGLFDPFSQETCYSPGSSGGNIGTGLGLFISKKFIEAMGGEIQVKSEVGNGTEFIVSLELEREFDSKRLFFQQLGWNNEMLDFLSKIQFDVQGDDVDPDFINCMESLGVDCSKELDYKKQYHVPVFFGVHEPSLMNPNCSIIVSTISNLPKIDAIFNESEKSNFLFFTHPITWSESIMLLNQIKSKFISSMSVPKSVNINPPLKVLLVEDNQVIRLVLSKLFSQKNVLLTETVNGLEGLESFKEQYEKNNKFDVVLMDYHMPVMNGEKSCFLLRSFEKEKSVVEECVVLFMTAAVSIDVIQSCKEVGATDILHKPVHFDKMCEVLEKYFPGRW